MRPGTSGQFDIFVGAALAYSRHATGRFPAEADLETVLRRNP
ncbi:MAG: Rdx family protein [Burkholderiales bacterium]|nr:Rdx family protein [Burkholderiales bacterium]